MGVSAGAIRAAKAFVEIFADDSKFQQGMTRVRTSIASVGQQLRRGGTSMFLGGAALGAPLLLAVRSAANFENALFDARSSAGLTADEVGRVRDKALELSRAGLGGPTSIAQAFTALIKAGMPLEQAMNGAGEAVVMFASNAGIDATQAAEIASDAFNVFGKSAQESTDILKGAADSSSTSVQGLVSAFAQSSAAAGLANQTMETTAAALAVLAQAGVKGSDAGTSLKTMLLRLTSPSMEAASALAQVGLSTESFRGADGEMLPLANVLDILTNSLAGLNKPGQDAVLYKVFGSDAIRAATILLKSGSDGLDAMGQKMLTAGSNADAYKLKMTGITGAMVTVSSAAERLQITIATALGPAIQSGAQSLAGFMDFLGQIATQFPGLVTAAGALSVALLGLGAAGIAIGTTLQGLAVAMKVAQAAMALFALNPVVLAGIAVVTAAIAGIGITLRALIPEFKTVTDEYLKMLGLMKSEPIPGQAGKLVEARDIAPALSAEGGGRMKLQLAMEKQMRGEDVNIPEEFKKIVDEESTRVAADGSLSAKERFNKLAKLSTLSQALGSQLKGMEAAATAAKAAEADKGKFAGPTTEQLAEAEKVREQNMTPAQKNDQERNRLLQLLNAQALDEQDFLTAVNRIEEEANKERIAKAQEQSKGLQDKADALREQMATPEETLRKRIAEIQSLPLDPDTRARAIERAKADAVSALTQQGGEGRSIVSAGTFGDAAMLGIGPELADPARETAENTRRMVEEIARLATAFGEPAVQAGVPVQPPAIPFGIGAEVAAPRVADVRQAVDNGMAAAGETMTLSQAMQTTTAQMVAAIGRTTEAVEKTLTALEKIVTNTTDMGAVFS